MRTFTLGQTGLTVSRTGFGALPIQRITTEEAVALLRKAFEAGITMYDTARAYTDSEEKIGRALSDVRREIVIATKSKAEGYDELMDDLEVSLDNLRTDYIDILQLHNPKTMPDPDDPSSAYAALRKACDNGTVRHIGISSHRIGLAGEAVRSGMFETLQFPLNPLSDGSELSLVEMCREHDVGFIAMKALAGGLVNDVGAAFAFLRRFRGVVPIWGCQREAELEGILELEKSPPSYDGSMEKRAQRQKEELGRDFCRGCGYCLPCPADIPIPNAARMSLLLRRSPAERFYRDEWRRKMDRINDCEQCGQCHERCPYNLDPPTLLPEMLKDYEQMYAAFHQQ